MSTLLNPPVPCSVPDCPAETRATLALPGTPAVAICSTHWRQTVTAWRNLRATDTGSEVLDLLGIDPEPVR